MKYVSMPQLLLNMENGISRLQIWESAYYMLDDFAYTGVGLVASRMYSLCIGWRLGSVMWMTSTTSFSRFTWTREFLGFQAAGDDCGCHAPITRPSGKTDEGRLNTR